MKTSQDIAKEVLKRFPNECKVVTIKLLHTRVVNNFVRGIENAHKKAAHSKLRFGCSVL
jgi:hypothetical protein